MHLKISKKQDISIKDSDARLNVWVGAVRSGKTFSSLLRFDEFCLKGPPGDFAIVGKSLGTIKRNVLGPLKDILGSRFQYFLGRAEANLYNRTIHLIGANDERAEHKIRGSTLAGAYVDEITVIPYNVFKMLQSRLSVPGAKFFGSTNTDSPFHWVKVELLDRKGEIDLKHWDFVLDDNPSLDKSFKDSIKREYQGLWYERYIEGKWVLAEGTVYDFFDRNLHVIDALPGAADYYVVGVDYGTTNPCAFSLIGYSERTYPNRWLQKEYYYDSRKTLRQKTDTEYAEDLKKFIAGHNVRAIYIDPSAASFKVELQRQGFSGLIDADNDVLDGIRYTSICLSNGTFKVCGNCTKTLEEFSTYRWDPKASSRGEDKPLKENDHAMDACRYALYTHWFKKEGPRWTAEDIEQHKRDAGIIPDYHAGHGKFFDERMW
jgi:PBSX family phage terminase large subunit